VIQISFFVINSTNAQHYILLERAHSPKRGGQAMHRAKKNIKKEIIYQTI